jgi:hypothetical protein
MKKRPRDNCFFFEKHGFIRMPWKITGCFLLELHMYSKEKQPVIARGA